MTHETCHNFHQSCFVYSNIIVGNMSSQFGQYKLQLDDRPFSGPISNLQDKSKMAAIAQNEGKLNNGFSDFNFQCSKLLITLPIFRNDISKLNPQIKFKNFPWCIGRFFGFLRI